MVVIYCWPLYGVERWPHNRSFLSLVFKEMQFGPQRMAVIGKAAGHERWPLGRVLLYIDAIKATRQLYCTKKNAN